MTIELDPPPDDLVEYLECALEADDPQEKDYYIRQALQYYQLGNDQ